MKTGLTLVGCALLLLSLAACEHKKDPADRRIEGQASGSPEEPALLVDPMLFVEQHQDSFTKIIHDNWTDCEGSLAALLRYTADHKGQFKKDFKGKPANYQLPKSKGRRKITGLLMQWSKRCPEQISRLNQALRQLKH